MKQFCTEPSKPILIHFLVEPTPSCLHILSNTNIIVWRELGFTSIISPIFYTRKFVVYNVGVMKDFASGIKNCMIFFGQNI